MTKKEIKEFLDRNDKLVEISRRNFHAAMCRIDRSLKRMQSIF